MSYRTNTSPAPLVLSLPSRLVAVDPSSGARLWEMKLEESARRLFMVGPNLLVCCGNVGSAEILCVEMASGRVLGQVDLGFCVTAGLVHGDRLYIAASGGAACVGVDGRIVWRALVERAGKGLFEGSDMVCRDATGRELWRIDQELQRVGDNVGLVLDGLIAQPDQRA